eukprot:CAMPEP_0169082192 /NCGR_PEP_ID=MMETSP1015-20121227/11413_1 /TAXON_ID=342587 /ORGANISM="Karlodinium micrum, Strain CCMP2283" /LENGTH=259 /DNA_ID=CAMNT_0009142031 /DNA_START=800 /DNA_END=1580 /DNA_ORIENTATION=-
MASEKTSCETRAGFDIEDVDYLQTQLDAHGLMYLSFSEYRKLDNNPLNLERYSEDMNINEHVVDSSESRPIAQHSGHHAVASTTELGAGSSSVLVEAVPNQGASVECEGVVATRDNRDGRQCQLCNRVFSSRNLLFQHLRDVHGELPRTGVDDRAHRRRWKMRARKRAIASRGGSMDAKVDTVRAAQVRASGGDLQVVEESEKTCIVCNRDYTVGKDARRLPCGHAFHASCIDKWLRICRDRCFDPRCPICDAMVDRPE